MSPALHSAVSGAGGAHDRARQRGRAPPPAPDHPSATIPGPGAPDPWLVSFALWANVLQYLDDDGTTVAELRARARTEPAPPRWPAPLGVRRPSRRPPVEALRNPPQDDGHRATPESRALRARDGVAPDCPASSTAAGASAWARRPSTRLERALRDVFDRAAHRSAGLSPRRPSDPGRQGWRTAVDVATRRRSVSAVIFDRRPVTAPQRRAVRLHGRLRVDVTDLPAHQRQHLARARPARARASATCRGSPACRGRPTPCAPAGWNAAAASSPNRTRRHGGARSSASPSKGEKAQQQVRSGSLGATEESWRTDVRRRPPSTSSVARARAFVGDGTFAASPLAPGLVPHPDNWRAGARPPRDAPAPSDGAAPRRLPRWQLRRPGSAPRRMWQAGIGAPLSPRRRVAPPRRRGVRRAGHRRRHHRRRRGPRRRQPRPEDRPGREGRLRLGHVLEVLQDDPRRHPLPPAA